MGTREESLKLTQQEVVAALSDRDWAEKFPPVMTLQQAAQLLQIPEQTLFAELPRNAGWVLTAPPSARYPRGDHQISERRLLKSLKRVLKQLGLKGHLHTFRHSFIMMHVTQTQNGQAVRETASFKSGEGGFYNSLSLTGCNIGPCGDNSSRRLEL